MQSLIPILPACTHPDTEEDEEHHKACDGNEKSSFCNHASDLLKLLLKRRVCRLARRECEETSPLCPRSNSQNKHAPLALDNLQRASGLIFK